MNSTADAHALVSAARDLIRDDDIATAGLWPRAAALLARQGLELAMARLWEVTAPGLERTSTRCQLLCVGDMLNDRQLGGRATLTWQSLSNACHHRAYELPPTASELSLALEMVWDLAESVERLRGKIQA
jgi:hypothetical protein